ncbi:hypothetical protein BKI52_45160 [marine bacterium AO1-C]|nr:hypothetical protein BKI52_45160 [marine bacterium AO1-C]
MNYLKQIPADFGNFNVYRRNEFTCKNHMVSHRRDFYKISLIKGQGKLYYANRGVDVSANALLFSNPMVPYKWEATSQEQTGYFCVFKEGFLSQTRQNNSFEATESPFKIGADSVFFLEPNQQAYVSTLFEQMLTENTSDYIHKHELLKNYIHLLIHEALKIRPNTRYFKYGSNASERITYCFIELLSRQFPIDSPEQQLRLKTPTDFAQQLSVHVNYLNRSVKEITGNTTSEMIAQRVVEEAKALLLHTNWNIAEIALCLGFPEPAYFSNFFKKRVAHTPGQYRKTKV